MRQQHCKDADYDASSYIAVRCVGDGHKEIGKDQNSHYIYLTKNRNEAAVWTWQQWQLRDDDVKRLETPYRWMSKLLAKSQWLYKERGQIVELQNVHEYPMYRFNE